MSKLILNDDGFTMLGNAILLGYLVKAVKLGSWETSEKERLEDRREYSERRELREILELAGALDRRIVGNIEVPGKTKFESMAEWKARIVELANSSADIAKLRIKDIDFSSDYLAPYEFHALLAQAEPFELRMPLAELGPTKLTRSLEAPVMDYFTDCMAIASPDALPAQSGDKGEADVDPNPRGYNRGFMETDAPYVEEGLEMLRAGTAKSALDAANKLVEKYGEVTTANWEAGSEKIRSLTMGAAVNRLQKKISKAWRATLASR